MLERLYFGNTARQYLVGGGVFLAALCGFILLRRVVIGRLRWLAERTATKIDDLLVDLLEMIRIPECYLVAFYAATRPLFLPGWLNHGFRAIVIVVVTFRLVTMLQRLAAYSLTAGLFKDSSQDPAYEHTVKTVSYLVNALIWVGAAVFTLDNLGFSVSSMLAGLGIGGIAVALAAQAVLGDLFAAVAIYLDRPFVIGDAIAFGDTSGTVLRIGFKTTRLRALSGEELVIPNSVLASAKVQNFRHLRERRVGVKISVAYGTSAESLARLPSEMRGLLEQAGGDKARVDRVHLQGLGPSSIDFELVYFVLSADYGLHMDISQRFHLALLAHLESRGIEIPFPTKTVHVRQGAAAFETASREDKR